MSGYLIAAGVLFVLFVLAVGYVCAAMAGMADDRLEEMSARDWSWPTKIDDERNN